MDTKQLIINSISDFEQRIFIKFAVLLGWSGGVILDYLKKAIGKRAFARRTVYSWIKKINDGETDLSEHRGGDRSDHELRNERVLMIRDAMDESRHWSVRSLALHLEIPAATVERIVKNELQMKKKMGKWVPHELSAEQIMTRILASKQNLRDYKKHRERLNRTFTVDEAWVSLYMKPNRNQAKVYLFPNENPPEIPHENIHAPKRMLIMAMDFDGIAFWKLLPEKTTVTAEAYVSFLKEKLPKWMSDRRLKSAVLLHDNARPHAAKITKEYLRQQNIDTWFHPACSPDISPLDFNCFAKLKDRLRGKHYKNWNDFETSIEEAVNYLNNNRLVLGVQMLPDRWQQIIESEGAYL